MIANSSALWSSTAARNAVRLFHSTTARAVQAGKLPTLTQMRHRPVVVLRIQRMMVISI